MRNISNIVAVVFALLLALPQSVLAQDELQSKIDSVKTLDQFKARIDCRPICGTPYCCVAVMARTALCVIDSEPAQFEEILHEKGAEGILRDCLSETPSLFTKDKLETTVTVSDPAKYMSEIHDSTTRGCKFCCWKLQRAGDATPRACGACWTF